MTVEIVIEVNKTAIRTPNRALHKWFHPIIIGSWIIETKHALSLPKPFIANIYLRHLTYIYFYNCKSFGITTLTKLFLCSVVLFFIFWFWLMIVFHYLVLRFKLYGWKKFNLIYNRSVHFVICALGFDFVSGVAKRPCYCWCMSFRGEGNNTFWRSTLESTRQTMQFLDVWKTLLIYTPPTYTLIFVRRSEEGRVPWWSLVAKTSWSKIPSYGLSP